MNMEDPFFDAKNKDHLVDSCIEGKVSDCENLPQSAMLTPREKRVRFSRTQVYYFNRQQGHSSVPQRGGCSLGMASVHFHSEVHRESAFRKMRQSEKRLNLANNFTVPSQPNGRGRRRKYKHSRVILLPPSKDIEENVNTGDDRRIPLYISPPKLSPQRYDSSEPEITQVPITRTPSPPCLSPQKEIANIEISVDIPETDSENSMESISVSKTTTKKLLPLPPVVRTRLLKQAGVSSIDDSERLNCALLRNSRITVGCGCISTFCNPETCSCALEGIPCQVDRPAFPCSCSDQCKNPCGRVEFSTARVRSHALHVLQRLADEGDRSQPVSSEHGECLKCLQERLSQLGSSPKSPPPSPVAENPPPSPPPLHSPVFHTSIYDLPPPPLVSTSPHSPVSPDGADHSIFRSPLVTPISMNCAIMAASTPTSKAIVVYKPPFSLLRECFERIIDTEVPQQIPKSVTEGNPTEKVMPLNDVPVVDDVHNIIKPKSDLEMVKETLPESAGCDAFLQGKAIFTTTSSILRTPSPPPPPPKIPTKRAVKYVQTLTTGPNPECMLSLDRLSLRKRRIIRSPCLHSIRKRMTLNVQLQLEHEQQSPIRGIPPPFVKSPSVQSQAPSDAPATASQGEDDI
ncbi:unnamed protein product [Hymenolepis diminuta]|uniref:Cysteine/serine-rich nuclear protein N-terminal domain-containing protein n=1 Tax=Hymenolepis diminuta TaxID=6216 RepID=A0A564YAP5_HYMDI|nr:unnamed protein product [Hymenolepis diminuta]